MLHSPNCRAYNSGSSSSLIGDGDTCGSRREAFHDIERRHRPLHVGRNRTLSHRQRFVTSSAGCPSMPPRGTFSVRDGITRASRMHLERRSKLDERRHQYCTLTLIAVMGSLDICNATPMRERHSVGPRLNYLPLVLCHDAW